MTLNPFFYPPSPKDASRLLDTAGVTVYYPMLREWEPIVRGVLGVLEGRKRWIGTEQEIDDVLAMLIDLRAADVVTGLQLETGVQDMELQTVENGGQLEYRVKIADVWSAWRNAGALAAGPQGIQGEPGLPGSDGTDGREIVLAASHPVVGGVPAPNIIDVFSRYEDELEFTLLERLTAPIVEEATGQPVTYVEPRWLVAGNLAEPEGRYQIWDGSAWVSSGTWFSIGDTLTAPQGEQGIQGIQGPIGPMGLDGPIGLTGEPGPGYYTTSGQFGYRDWMWIATKLIDMACETMEILYAYPPYEWQVELYRLIVGLGATSIPNIGAMIEWFGALDPAYTIEVFQDEDIKEAAAKLLYCEIVNRQNMSSYDLGQIVLALGTVEDWESNVANADHLIAAVVPEQFSLLTNGEVHFRSLLGRLRVEALSQGIKPNWVLGCTPTYTDWQATFDFVSEAPGGEWLIVLGAWADSLDGVRGLLGGDCIMQMIFGGVYQVTTIEILWSVAGATDPFIILQPLDEFYPIEIASLATFRLDNMEWSTDNLYINIGTGGPGEAYSIIHRVQIAGIGEPPPWATS
jgi:hypothetical protein